MLLRVRAASEPWPDSAQRAHRSIPSQRSRSKGSLQCPALPAPCSPELAPRRARGFRLPLRWGEQPGGASRATVRHTPGRGGAAPAQEPALSPPSAPGRSGRRPAPASRDCGGGRHPAPQERAGGEESVQKLRASSRRTMALLSTRRASPLQRGPCTYLYSLLGSEGRWSIGIQIFCTRL